MSKKLMIIDGHSIMNRAFYAIPLLTNKKGIYTNAVYGFFNMFFKFLDEEKPDYVAVAFDLPKPTFRHLKYSQYKGTRKRMPDELRPQIELLKELLAKMEIKIYELAGFEADDILGTIAKKAEKKGIDSVIISGDRDLLQLATENIKIRIPKTKSGKTEIEDYLSKDVLDKYGVSPKQFIEVKALMGDTSDNIPGVAGIGEKTAISIIQKYDTVENAIENASEIKPKKASENLITYKEQAMLSKELVTIEIDAPIEFNESEVFANNMFNNEVFDEFKELEFKSFASRFSNDEVYTKTELKFNFINTLDEAKTFFENLLKNNEQEVFYQIFLEEEKLFGISICFNEQECFFVKLEEHDLIQLSKPFFEGSLPKIAYNLKENIIFLQKLGIELNNVIFDTIISAYVLNSTQTNYDYNVIANEFLSENYPSLEEIFGKGKAQKTLFEIDENEALKYCCESANVLFRAKKIMQEQLKENEQEELYFNIELPLVYVLADMQIFGIKVDNQTIIEYGENLDKKINTLTDEIYWLAGEDFNINSPKQLGVILFEKLGLKGGKKTKTGYSTSADVLEKLKDKSEIINKILQYRTLTKLKSTYVDGLLNVIDEDTGRIYSNFKQTVTATGRISSTEPNLQNIPIKLELGRELRKAFKPENDDFIFVDADYSQIELRVLAHLSEDENLIKAFKEGQDIHSMTATKIFNTTLDEITSFQRSAAKTINFGIIYGKQAFTLSQDLGISKKEAEEYINEYFNKYPKIKQFLENCVKQAQKDGYSKTFFNRIRYIPEINSTNFLQKGIGERVAMNMPIQGAAADIIKLAMIKVHRRLKKEGLKSRLILQVHDELLIETYKEEESLVYEILNDEMKNVINFSVPLDIDVHSGKNWYETK